MLRLSHMLCLDYEESLRQSTSYVQLMKCHYDGGSQQWKWIATNQQVSLIILTQFAFLTSLIHLTRFPRPRMSQLLCAFIMAALCNRRPLYFCPVISIYLSIYLFFLA